MVINLTRIPIKKDIDQGSENELTKEDEVGFFCSSSSLHTQAVLLTPTVSNRWFSGSKLPTKGIKSVSVFFKFHLVLSQSYGAVYKQNELPHMLHSLPMHVLSHLISKN